jgi:hypothetical protein
MSQSSQFAAADLATVEIGARTLRGWFVTGIIGVLFLAGLRIGIPAYRQQQTISAIERAGREVHIELHGPRWLARWIARHRFDGFGTVHEVWFVGSDISNEVLDLVGSLEELDGLLLASPQFTGAAISRLASLKRLHSLDLGEGQYTDECLAQVSKMDSLRSLALSGVNFTNAGLAHLESLTNLEELFLDRTGVTANGVKVLQRSLPKTLIKRRDGGIGCYFSAPGVRFKHRGEDLVDDE